MVVIVIVRVRVRVMMLMLMLMLSEHARQHVEPQGQATGLGVLLGWQIDRCLLSHVVRIPPSQELTPGR